MMLRRGQSELFILYYGNEKRTEGLGKIMKYMLSGLGIRLTARV